MPQLALFWCPRCLKFQCQARTSLVCSSCNERLEFIGEQMFLDGAYEVGHRACADGLLATAVEYPQWLCIHFPELSGYIDERLARRLMDSYMQGYSDCSSLLSR